MGAPLGNTNALKNKPYYDALRRVLAQLEVKDETGKVIVPAGEALRALIEAQVKAGIRGDTSVARDVRDTLDGKPAQQVQIQGDAEQPLVARIEQVIVDPSDAK